ncbi:FHA domain-containing protein [Streptomyces sp. NBC_00341]|uniref:FHA domain-containing protein n=1 Tax=Streptomyces sp. NBC_00341 TaxID=2975717 RepID=UPI003084DA60|nr:FHA domain-containing protein [Streptomyces sp. NBC_00341]
MTGAVRGAGVDDGGRDDAYDDLDEWEPVLPEGVPATPPPPPESPAADSGVRCPGCAALVPSVTVRCPRCLARVGSGEPGRQRARGGPMPAGARAVLYFDTLALSLPVLPGEPLRLGRDPGWAPDSAGSFREQTTVSRRHAGVSLDPDGTVWVTEETGGTMNGTWVNDTPLLPGERHRLRHGDRLRLGRTVGCTVRLAGEGPC